jgi:hypothetical protein
LKPVWISDDRLSAYLDGEVPAEEAQIIEDAAARDAELAERQERLRQLNRVLSETCAQIDRTPLPGEILAAFAPRPAGTDPGEGKLLRFAARGGRPRAKRSWAALAASAAFLAGLGSGMLLMSGGPHSSGTNERQLAGILAPSGPLFQVLETRPAGHAAAIGGKGGQGVSVLPVLTFTSGSGNYCREYVISSGRAAMRGLACRDSGVWKNTVLVAQQAPAPASSADRYVAAEGPAPSLFEDAVNSLNAGEPLSAEAERRLIERGWRQ